jgi:hypothetical protein
VDTLLVVLCLALSDPNSIVDPNELPTIQAAAVRNGIEVGSEDWKILLAIRKAENGKDGRQFGILHPKALKQIAAEPSRSLDIQAGWCAATIVKNRARWDGRGDFIEYLGSRYCPADAHPLNRNWVRVVKYWLDRQK